MGKQRLSMVLADLRESSTKIDYSVTEYHNTLNQEIKTLDPLIVCGPSGVGKGTIISRFMDEHDGSERFGFTTSHTTRLPREGEIDSVHYHFTTKDKMLQQIANGEFLEHAEVHGNIYGTSHSSIQDVYETGKRCLLDIDVQGVKNVRSVVEKNKIQQSSKNTSLFTLEPKFIFIAPPSFEVLKQRLVGRGTETEESIQRRTANAKAELEYGLTDGNFDMIVVNDDLDVACDEFSKCVTQLYGL